jgi:hypothetical protein
VRPPVVSEYTLIGCNGPTSILLADEQLRRGTEAALILAAVLIKEEIHERVGAQRLPRRPELLPCELAANAETIVSAFPIFGVFHASFAAFRLGSSLLSARQGSITSLLENGLFRQMGQTLSNLSPDYTRVNGQFSN